MCIYNSRIKICGTLDGFKPLGRIYIIVANRNPLSVPGVTTYETIHCGLERLKLWFVAVRYWTGIEESKPVKPPSRNFVWHLCSLQVSLSNPFICQQRKITRFYFLAFGSLLAVLVALLAFCPRLSVWIRCTTISR